MKICLRESLVVVAVLVQAVSAFAAPELGQPARAEAAVPALSAEESQPGQGGLAGQLVLTNGSALPGEFAGMKGTHLQWRMPLFAEPFVMDRQALHGIDFEDALEDAWEDDLEDDFHDLLWMQRKDALSWPRMIYQDAISSGKLDIQDGMLRWHPSGAVAPVRLLAGHPVRFELGSPLPNNGFDAATFSSLLFLVGGDVVPCRIETIDDTFLHAEVPFTGRRKFSLKRVQAVDIGKVAHRKLRFEDIRWKPIPKTVERIAEEDKIVFHGDAVLTSSRFWGSGPYPTEFVLRWPRDAKQGSISMRWSSGDPEEPLNMWTMTMTMTMRAGNLPKMLDFEVLSMSPMHQRGNAGSFNSQVQLDPDLTARISIECNGNLDKMLSNRETIYDGNLGRWHSELPLNQLRITVSDCPGLELSDLSTVASPRMHIDEETRRRMLIIPRRLRADPPTHVLVAQNGDLLRGRFLGLDEKTIRFRAGGQDFQWDLANMATLIWLHPGGLGTEPELDGEAERVQARLNVGGLVSMAVDKITEDSLVGLSPVLGPCTIPLEAIDELRVGNHPKPDDLPSFEGWTPTFAISPRWSPEEPATTAASTMIGKKVGPIKAPLLGGGHLKLPDPAGRVVVLDFWASWCAPCVQIMPEYIEMIKRLDPDKVRFVAVNLGESVEAVNACLENRDWDVPIVLDADEAVAQKFHVEAIPHTVVLGPDGTVRWSSSRSHPGSVDQLRRVVSESLD